MGVQPAESSTAATLLRTVGKRRWFRHGNKKSPYTRLQRGETLAAYLFLTPYLLVLFVFFAIVSIYGVGLSLFTVDIGFTPPQFVGFHNYQILFQQLFTNPSFSPFWISIANIIKFTVIVVSVQTVLALMLALLLQTLVRGKGVFRTIFYIPAITSSVATSLIFLWLYNPEGLINYLLSLIHIPGPDWLNDPFWALPSLMMLNIWSTAAAFMIYFLAALQDLPREILEAAEVDGANRFQVFWHVTVPLLRPTTFLVVALGTIGAFQMFDQAKFMTDGGPLNSTLTPMLEIYKAAFNDSRFGSAAAMSVILFLIIFVVTILQRRFIDTSIQG
ncbi:MAG: sugar ABC transporter permease [Ktedonobacteraceae bacterium]|nr:sugar ABC transporter permease [Ktedonobacteraceae bacterium]